MKSLLTSILLFVATMSFGATPPPDPADLVRLDEALRLAETLGPRVWPGFSASDAPIILVRGDFEYLLNTESTAEGFVPLNGQSFRTRPVFVRARTLPPNLLASFPAIGRDAVVVGTPEATRHAPATWTLVICHELFHVYQGQHGMVEKVARLEIGPQMDPSWQLGYPFPYDDPRVIAAMHLLGHETFLALQNPEGDTYGACVVQDAVQNLLDVVNLTAPKTKNAAYLEFVVTKEGVARYFEYRLAQLAATNYTPGKAFEKQEGRDAFERTWRDEYAAMPNTIKHLGRVSHSRSEFYASASVSGSSSTASIRDGNASTSTAAGGWMTSTFAPCRHYRPAVRRQLRRWSTRCQSRDADSNPIRKSKGSPNSWP